MQPDSSTKHIARVKPSQYIAQPQNRQASVTAAVAAVIRLTRATPKAPKSLT